jgi:hypothetical protein
MNNKVLGRLIAGALATTLALASPALARGGGGGGGHGGMGGHASAMGGSMRGGAMGGAMQFSAMRGNGMIGGTQFSGSRFAGSPLAAHAALSPRFSGLGFRGHHHHHFHRFAFFGGPFVYAAYDSCWRRAWTPYGLQWVNVCYDYGY